MLFEYVSSPTEPSEMMPDTASEDGVHGQLPPHARVGHGGLYLPAEQSTQELSVEEPTVTEYLPAPQFVQELSAMAPVVVRYLPAPQLLQTEAEAAEKVPAVQPPQTEAAMAPTTAENVPAPQPRHSELPLTFLYFPATHAWHNPSGPVNPALQGTATTH